MNIQFSKKQRIILLITIGVFGCIYMLQVIMNHYLMRTYALDYGFYNQAFWDFAHFRSNFNTVMEPQLNYFQVHPGFTLLLLSPLYHLFNPIFGTYSLLIIQNIFIIIGGYCTFLLLVNKTGDFWVGLLAFIHFNLVWGHYSALSADFIEATVGASMVPVFLYAFDKHRHVLASLVFLFILACKENMPIWFIFISIVLFFTYKDKKQKILSVSYGIFSILYLIILFRIIIPSFEEPGITYWGFAYSSLGENPSEAVKFIITRPVEALRLLFVNHLNDPAFDNIKKELYIVFLLSGGLLLLRRPVYILAFIPIIAQKVYNDAFIRWGISSFYSIEIVSILTAYAFLASLNKKRAINYILYISLCLSTLGITLNKMNSRRSLWYVPDKEALLHRGFYQTRLDVKEIRKRIRTIVPENAAMVTTQSIVPHFSHREKISIFPYVHDANYMVLLKDGNPYPLNHESFEKESNRYLNDKDWSIIFNEHPLIILKRKIPKP